MSGIPLYRCEEFEASMTVETCGLNQEVSGLAEPKMGKAPKGASAKAKRAIEAHGDWFWRMRRERCTGCPGVLELRRRELAQMEAR